jgi:hypothetical protein
MSILIVVSDGFLDDLGASLAEAFNEASLALFFQFARRFLDQGYRFVLELVAAKTGHHDALVRQIQLLLRTNLLPSVTHKQGQTIHRHILAVPRFRE